MVSCGLEGLPFARLAVSLQVCVTKDYACRHKHPSSLRPHLFDCADASLLMFTPAVKPSFLAGVLFLVFDSVSLSF